MTQKISAQVIGARFLIDRVLYADFQKKLRAAGYETASEFFRKAARDFLKKGEADDRKH